MTAAETYHTCRGGVTVEDKAPLIVPISRFIWRESVVDVPLITLFISSQPPQRPIRDIIVMYVYLFAFPPEPGTCRISGIVTLTFSDPTLSRATTSNIYSRNMTLPCSVFQGIFVSRDEFSFEDKREFCSGNEIACRLSGLIDKWRSLGRINVKLYANILRFDIPPKSSDRHACFTNKLCKFVMLMQDLLAHFGYVYIYIYRESRSIYC